VCAGKSALPYAAPGFWTRAENTSRSGANSDEYNSSFIACDAFYDDGFCPGGKVGALTSYCKSGYSGVACAECEAGHYKFFGVCYSCNATDNSKSGSILLVLVLIAVWFLINNVFCEEIESLDVFLSFAQMANVIGEFNIAWPRAVTSGVFRVASLLDFDVDIVNMGCVASTSWPFDFGLQLLLPVMYTAVFAAQIGVRHQWRSLRSPKRAQASHLAWKMKVISGPLKFLSVVYLTVSRYSTSVFRCVALSDGTLVLQAYPGMQCNTTQHLWYYACGVIGIVVYTIGFPLGLGVVLVYMHLHGRRTDELYLKTVGWVYEPFEAHVFFYGVLTILRRTIFVIISQISDPLWQSVISICTVTIFGAFHLKTEPYKDYMLDQLDFVLLSCLTVVAVSSLVFQLEHADDLDNPFFMFWQVLVLATCVGSLLAAVLTVLIEVQNKALRVYIQRFRGRVAMRLSLIAARVSRKSGTEWGRSEKAMIGVVPCDSLMRWHDGCDQSTQRRVCFGQRRHDRLREHARRRADAPAHRGRGLAVADGAQALDADEA
jgi:hypothetical protein